MTEVYDRQHEEPSIWFKRFVIYRNLGPDRTLLGAVKKADKSGKKRITKTPGAWDEAFAKWRWKERAEAYDAAIYAEQERNAAILRQLEQEEKQRILTTGYAAIERRVEALDNMARNVENSFIDKETGEINYKFMSPEKLREWRGMLDDIAKELGHRVAKKEISGKDGGAIEIVTTWGGAVVDEGN